MKYIISALCLVLFTSAAFAQAEKPPQAFLDGMKAKENAQYKEAAALFRKAIEEKPKDVSAHHQLGKTLVHLKAYPEAIDAFETILRLNTDHERAFYYHYEIGKIHLLAQNYPSAAAEYRWLKSEEKPIEQRFSISPRLVQSDRAETIVPALPALPRTNLSGELAQYLLDMFPPEIAARHQLPAPQVIFAAASDSPNALAQNPKETTASPTDLEAMTADVRPKIIYQEKANYTEIARQNRVSGSVMLSVVFEATGQISNIRVIRGLPDGLTQCAIRAAQRIRFQPAIKNGSPVNVRGTMEFMFNLY